MQQCTGVKDGDALNFDERFICFAHKEPLKWSKENEENKYQETLPVGAGCSARCFRPIILGETATTSLHFEH